MSRRIQSFLSYKVADDKEMPPKIIIGTDIPVIKDSVSEKESYLFIFLMSDINIKIFKNYNISFFWIPTV
jgi:hypothetical protein